MDEDRRPRPGRRRLSNPLQTLPCFRSRPLWLLLILFLTLFHQTTALDQRRAARRGEILIDPRPTPRHRRLSRRQDASFTGASLSTRPASTSVAFVGTTTLASPSPSSTSLSVSLVASSIATDTSTSIPSALPQPFDASLGNNFTSSSCPTFFDRFLDDPSFQSCLPLSLLLQVRPLPF